MRQVFTRLAALFLAVCATHFSDRPAQTRFIITNGGEHGRVVRINGVRHEMSPGATIVIPKSGVGVEIEVEQPPIVFAVAGSSGESKGT